METRPAQIASHPLGQPALNRPTDVAPLPEVLEVVDDYDPALDYRAISSAAVASLALGILSALALLDWWLGLIPFSAMALGVIALRKIRAQPQEYTGFALAVTGIALAAVFWVAGAAWLGYVYATEVPAGYQRISYAELQPEQADSVVRIPEDAIALDGEKVFLKGYVYPGQRLEGITRFLLVRDQGDCCFGGNPKITERIQVSLANSRGFTFSSRLFKVAGTFRIERRPQAIDGPGGVIYHLDEALLR